MKHNKINKTTGINIKPSIIIQNMNDLSSPIKWHRIPSHLKKNNQTNKKQDPSTYGLQRNIYILTIKDKHSIEVKE